MGPLTVCAVCVSRDWQCGRGGLDGTGVVWQGTPEKGPTFLRAGDGQDLCCLACVDMFPLITVFFLEDFGLVGLY